LPISQLQLERQHDRAAQLEEDYRGRQAEAPLPHQNTNEKLCCFLDFLDFLGSFQNFAVANTRGADANAARGSVDQGAYRLQIHIPATLRNIMGVADSIAELRALSTNCANLCHTKNFPSAAG
jgi:hypothetical protein